MPLVRIKSTSAISATFDASRLTMKHRFAGEEPVDADAVEPSSKLTITVEHLDAVRPSELVQSRIGGDEVFADPAVFARRIGARADDARETGVDPNLVPLGALPHRPRDAQPIERHDAPRIRRPPAEHARQPGHLHREDAPAVGVDDRRGLEIAPDA